MSKYIICILYQWQIPALADFIQRPIEVVQKYWDEDFNRGIICEISVEGPVPEYKCCPTCQVLMRVENAICKTEGCDS